MCFCDPPRKFLLGIRHAPRHIENGFGQTEARQLLSILMKVQLRTGDRWWLAVPPVAYRWALIGAYHDRLGHSGVSQTFAFVHQPFHWPGIKADIEAYIRQCHACQVRRLELQDVSHVGVPRMSGPFEHVHIDLAGPYELRAVATAPRRKKHGSTGTALSTQATGSAYVAITVDYFTKAARSSYPLLR